MATPTLPARMTLAGEASTRGSADIAAELRRAIFDGVYAYRDRLPAERHLAEHFGASRGTVRRALSLLEDMSLVSRRAGSGTFVRHREFGDGEEIAEITSPLQLIEVRMAVEPRIAQLAVLNASAREVDNLALALREVESCGRDPERFSRADEAFHLALAECARNPLMYWIYRQINGVRRHTQWNVRKDRILTPERIEHYNAQHRSLYTAIEGRDADRAVRTLGAHLEKARSDLLGVDSE